MDPKEVMNEIVAQFVAEIKCFEKTLTNILLYKYMGDADLRAIEDIFVKCDDEQYNKAYNELSPEAKIYIDLHFDNKYWGMSKTGIYMSINSASATLQSCQDEDVYMTTLKQLDLLLFNLVISGHVGVFPQDMTFFDHAPFTSNHSGNFILETNFNFMRASLSKKHREVFAHLFTRRA